MKYYIFQIRNAFEDFKRNKTRTFLASLGIMIGVLSVVMLISLGLGLKNYISNRFEDLGANLIIIFPGAGLSGGAASFGPGFAGGAQFDERDINSLSKITDADYIVPMFMKSVLIETGNEEQYGYVFGTNADAFRSMNMKPLAGRLLDKGEMERRSKDVVLGYEIAKKLFDNPEDGVGKTLRINNQSYKVVGVAEKTGDNEGDRSVIMSYRTTFGSLNPDKTFFAIYLGVVDDNKVQEVKDEAEKILLKRYKADDFDVSDQKELLDVVNQIFNVLNGVLVAIGSISLVVGGIGIMNIMYANVTERTKEIGIRRAIGATKKDILMQFLAESVMLSGFGGILGLGISTLIVVLVRPFFPLGLNALAIIVALGISSFIGVFFGVFPARRAANLTPIEAIRYE
jgi:putative ABC transport system permease protein